jgi:hypothetical protein
MSKRKVMAGGYEESSDDFQPDPGNSPQRPPRRVAYAPPRLTTASKAGPGVFQLPGVIALPRAPVPPSRHLSLPSTSSRRPTPAIESAHSARNTPDIQVCEYRIARFDIVPYLGHSGGTCLPGRFRSGTKEQYNGTLQ